jgi:hypothetical protein
MHSAFSFNAHVECLEIWHHGRCKCFQEWKFLAKDPTIDTSHVLVITPMSKYGVVTKIFFVVELMEYIVAPLWHNNVSHYFNQYMFGSIFCNNDVQCLCYVLFVYWQPWTIFGLCFKAFNKSSWKTDLGKQDHWNGLELRGQ